MAKKDKKKSKKDTRPADPVGAVRTAVERTFQATADGAQSTRTRAQDLVDELAGAAGRVREMIEDINVLEDLKKLRAEVETLTRRVADLEDKPAPARKPASRSRARSSTTRKTAASSTAKAAGTARSTAAKRSAANARPAAAKSRSSAAKPRSAAAKPRSTAAKKPASS